MTSLSRLNLRRNQIGDDTIIDWLQTGAFAPVKHLNLGWNKINNKGMVALTKSPMVSGVEELILDSNFIGNEGVTAIAQSKHMESLTVLEMHDNKYNQTGANSLMDLRIRNLVKKYLSGTELNLNGKQLENQGTQSPCAFRLIGRCCHPIAKK